MYVNLAFLILSNYILIIEVLYFANNLQQLTEMLAVVCSLSFKMIEQRH